jgi:hypothetical protein
MMAVEGKAESCRSTGRCCIEASGGADPAPLVKTNGKVSRMGLKPGKKASARALAPFPTN